MKSYFFFWGGVRLIFFSPKGDVFAHEVCDGSVRDKDVR